MKTGQFFTMLLFFYTLGTNAQSWNLTGNSGTNPLTNFIGTSDGQDVIFKKSSFVNGSIPLSGQIRYTVTSFGYNSLNLSSGTYNSVFGAFSLSGQNNTGGNNSVLGGQIMIANTTGSYNSSVGYQSMNKNTIGNNNVSTGYASLFNNQLGSRNTAIGVGAMYFFNPISTDLDNNGKNVAIGYQAGYNNIIGTGNVFIGYNSGYNETGSSKLYISNNGTISLISGDFFSRNLKFDVKKNSSSKVEIDGVLNYSGLRFIGLPNTSPSGINSTSKVLSVNEFGDVILVNDIGGGITASCSTANFLPLFSSTQNNLICSQIFDNGTSVGIGTTGNFGYTYNTGDFLALAPTSDTSKLRVNGIIWASGYFADSDEKFKKNIRKIEKGIETIQQLEGKTYLWNKEKDRNFDGGIHSGFIAQELEKVLPHIVITGEDGNKAVNYIEIIPYLVEAIKEQQLQINDLKSQLTDSFLNNNVELIQLSNTKIISISPNPSKDIISISFNIEKSVQSASLQVHDLNGIIMSSFNVKERDLNLTRTIQKENFGKGIYIVSLVINGKSIDAKKIIFE